MVLEELQKHFITYHHNNEFPSFEFLTAETTDNNTGLTIPNYWWLTVMPVGRQLLNKLADKDPAGTLALLQKANLDAAPASGSIQGITAFWWLARSQEGRQLLNKLADKDPAGTLALLQKANLDAAPASGSIQGITAFWVLARSEEGPQLLNKLADKDPVQTLALLQNVNLNAAPASGPDQDTTAFWVLAKSEEGPQLLNKLADKDPAGTLALLQKANLDVAPASGGYRGTPAFWFLAITTQGKQLLNKLADKDPARTLALLHKVNLDAAFWVLAKSEEGQQLIKKCPAILFSPTIHRVGFHGNAIIGRPKQNPLPEEKTFKKLFILAGMYEQFFKCLNQSDLALKNQLFPIIDPCIRLLWIEKEWPVVPDWHYQTLYQHIINRHPDLHFLDHCFLEKLVDNRIAELDPNERMRKLATLAVKKYRENKEKIIPQPQAYTPELSHYKQDIQIHYPKLVQKCLISALERQNMHAFDVTQDCRIMIIEEIGSCWSLTEETVSAAIDKAINQYRIRPEVYFTQFSKGNVVGGSPVPLYNQRVIRDARLQRFGPLENNQDPDEGEPPNKKRRITTT